MAELFVLRLVHILAGLFWVGTGLFNTFYLGPALKSAGPVATGAVMGSMQRRHLFTVLPVAALLTILSGLRLLWIASAGDPHWFQHRVGHAYSVSGALAIIGFLIGMFVARPAMVRAGKLGQSAASDGASREMLATELGRLQKRAALGNLTAIVLVVLAAAGMAIARYL